MIKLDEALDLYDIDLTKTDTEEAAKDEAVIFIQNGDKYRFFSIQLLEYYKLLQLHWAQILAFGAL